MTNQLDGLVFTKHELLVLLDAVNASYLIGIDKSHLSPKSEEDHIASIRTGIETLIERDLMRVEADFHVLDPALLQIASVVSRPELVSVASRSEADGTRRFTWYQSSDAIVEHTQPTAETYRFVFIPNAAALVSRIQFLFPTVESSGAEEIAFSLSKDNFFALNNLVQQNDLDKASEIFASEGIAAEASGLLLHDMRHSVYSGNLTIMRVVESEIVNGQDIAILGGEKRFWVVQTQSNDPNTFSCKAINAHAFGLNLFDAFMKITEPEGA